MGEPAEDTDAAYRAAPRARQFDPSSWGPDSYAKAKALTQRPFENPETGDQLLAAVSQYEQDHSAHPDFLDFSPGTDRAVGGEGGGSYAAAPSVETQVAGRAMGPLGAKAQQLASIPERAWKGFKEAGNDALVSGLQGATFDHGDDWVGSLQGAGKGAAIRAETAAARARSPVATFGGDALVQGPAMAAATALGLGPAAIGGVLGGLQSHGRSAQSGLAALPETAAGTIGGATIGAAADAVPGAAKWVGDKFTKGAARTGELADEMMLRMGGASGSDVGKLSKEQVKAYADSGRKLEFNKGLPTARDVEDRANQARDLYDNKTKAVIGSLGEGATVAPDAIQKRIRQGKGKYAEGEYASQPYRDKLDEIADSVANMRQIKKPVTYHATPSENVPQIATEGLLPREGGKNYDLKKNRDRVYFAADQPNEPIHEAMKGWAEKVSDTQGGKSMSLLRTTAPTQDVPGANAGIKIRTEPTAVSEVEYFDTGRGAWRPLSQYGKTEPKLLARENPAPEWWDDDPLLAAGDANMAERRPEVYGTATDVTPKPGSSTEMDLGRDTVFGTAYDGTPKLPEGSAGGALAQQQPQGGSAMTGRGITPDDITPATVQPYKQGIPFSEANKARQVWGQKTNFGSDSLEQNLQQGVYGAYNGALRSAAEDIMPGAGNALKDNMWNEHVALRYGDWARKRATAGNRLISPSDLGAAGIGAVTGALTGDPLSGAAIAGGINRFARGREAAIAEKGLSAASSGLGSVGSGASSLGQALEGFTGAPASALGARAGTASGPLAPKLMGAFAQDHKQAMDDGKGYKASSAVKSALAADPQAFGPHSDKLRKAVESGSGAQVSATLETLSHDPTFKQYQSKLQSATK